ncbi:MAG: PEP/pyruvate-binding domain-containing protein [Bacteroidia bacterium]|nr:PEP/pyruvate-binding domain-containing protein [Bacteroidia bacterium]
MKLEQIHIYIFLLGIAFLLNSSTGFSQLIYSGHISDVATTKDLQEVSITNLNRGNSVSSNAFGNFLLKNGVYYPAPRPEDSYSFFHNSLIWPYELDLGIRIYTLDGREIVKQELDPSAGSFIFPRLAYGMYVIQVRQGKDFNAYKAFSNSSQTFIVDKRADRRVIDSKTGRDTLLLEKEGYFDRKIVIPRQDTIMELKMMKGSYENLDYFTELIDPIAFELIQSSPSRSNVGGIQSVKFIDDRKSGIMYYMNTKLHKLHFSFAQEFLNFRQGNAIFNQTQYREGPERYMYPGSINYYEEIDKYVLQLVSLNEMSCENLKLMYENILKTSYFGDKLVFFSNKSDWDNCEGIPKISFEELYAGQNYQALNLEKNYGYLNKLRLADLEDTYLGRHDIVLLDGIPNDVSVVAGIITTEFQTPLSHINVLSNSRGTPNMALRDGWENPKLDSLIGELVYLEVQADSFIIRKADIEEAINFWSQTEPQDTVYLAKNTTTSGLIELRNAGYADVGLIGGKAANFAELMKIRVGSNPIPLPENPFAIPFYYYQQHIEAAGLDVFIQDMLRDNRFNSDPAYRKGQLEILRDSIRSAALNATLLELVRNKIQNFAEFSSIRFRSSTNAEDLEDFSGAGLYSSHSAKKDHNSKTIENAIRKVWASLWNWRAYEERSYYKIDHLSCAMGILVHRSFPDEDANGVLITRNLYNFNHGFIINVQYKEYSIVIPEPGILHDQIILFVMSNVPIPGGRFAIEYLGFSNVPELNGERVMTDAELNELGEYAFAVKRHFYDNVPNSCNCNFEDFAVDIEFKVDSEISARKVYLKQARLFR